MGWTTEWLKYNLSNQPGMRGGPVSQLDDSEVGTWRAICSATTFQNQYSIWKVGKPVPPFSATADAPIGSGTTASYSLVKFDWVALTPMMIMTIFI